MIKEMLYIIFILIITSCSTYHIDDLNQTLSQSISNLNPKSIVAILRLNTNGHLSKINDILVTKSKDIVSASDDKTIRVWNSKNGKEKRKILGEIGDGDEGKIYAIALSPDEKFLAVGGFIEQNGKYNSNKETNCIRIYNFKSGKLIQNLKAHKNVVHDLAFSPDGKYLISGSADSSANIWSVQDNFKLIDTIKQNNDEIYAVGVINRDNRHIFITAGLDGKLIFYSLEDKKVLKLYKLNYKLMYLATSNRNIAVCGFGNRIDIYNFNLEHNKTIYSKVKPAGLNYSKDDKFLIVGTGKYPYYINIYNAFNDYKKTQTFKKHKNTTTAVTFLDNKRAISGGGNNNEIYIWNIKDAKPTKKIEGVGIDIWSIGVYKDKIAWGSIDPCPKCQNGTENISGKLQKYIDLKNFKIGYIKDEKKFKRVNTSTKDFKLYIKKDGKLNLKNSSLVIDKFYKKIVITRNLCSGVRHNCFGIYKSRFQNKEYIISGGSNGVLRIYNSDGEIIANLIGHLGDIWAIAIDNNNDRLISVGDDHIIRVWDLRQINRKSFNYMFTKNEFHAILSKREIKNIKPTINIFITKNNEWVIWTPQGFYTASNRGEKFIGYHINRGFNREALFLDISRFRKEFFREDLIKKTIQFGKINIFFHRKIDIVSLLKAGLPPIVKILNKEHNISSDTLELNVSICKRDGGFDNLSFYIDNKLVEYMGTKKALLYKQDSSNSCTIFTVELNIPKGKHQIAVDATNASGNILSNRATFQIINRKQNHRKPNLYLLTISISNYKDKNLNLKFPNNDAKELALEIKKIAKDIFEHIYIYSLKDNLATKRNIFNKMNKISKMIGVDDVFILFISGHGITREEDAQYYFLTYNFIDKKRTKKIEEFAISQNEFKKLLGKIKATKVVLLIDTCQSGSVATSTFSSAIKRFTKDTGVAIITASTSSSLAIDGYKKHGIFTYTLLEAMRKKEVYNFAGMLTIGNIAEYIKYTLPKISKQKLNYKQTPVIYLQGDTTFAIGKL